MNNRIKQVRDYFGLSQSQFAQRINRSPGCVSNIESGGTHKVSDETLDSICSAFSVDRDWLVSGKGEMFPPGNEKSKVDKHTVGDRIRKVRKDRGLTQEQFAKNIGYSMIQIHYAESGKIIPSNDFLRAVAVKYRISFNWLLTGEGEEKSEFKPVDKKLIKWLNAHPDVLDELRIRAGLD